MSSPKGHLSMESWDAGWMFQDIQSQTFYTECTRVGWNNIRDAVKDRYGEEEANGVQIEFDAAIIKGIFVIL